MAKTIWKVVIRAEDCDTIREYTQFQLSPADSAKRMFTDHAWPLIRYIDSYCGHTVDAAGISYATTDPETGEVRWRTVAVYRPLSAVPKRNGWYRPAFKFAQK